MLSRGGYGVPNSSAGFDRTNHKSQNAIDTLESVQEAYRTLQGQFVELQIELRSAQIERDSLRLELRASNEALAEVSGSTSIVGGPGSLMADMSASVYTSEKSMKDLRDILRRKEEMIDKLLADLADAKHSYAVLEQSVKNNTIRHLTDLEDIKRRASDSSNQSQQLKDEVKILTEQRASLMNDLEAKNKIIEDMNEKYRLQTQTMLGLVAQVDSVKNDAYSLRSLKEGGDSTILDLNRALAEAKSDINLVIAERNSLRTLVAQQEAALRIQSEQSDNSLSILQQRQQLIDKFQAHTRAVEDELSRLQGVLQLVLSRSGDEMMSELLDLKHLVEVVTSVREKLSSPGSAFSNAADKNDFKLETSQASALQFHRDVSTVSSPPTLKKPSSSTQTPHISALSQPSLSESDIRKIRGLIEDNEQLKLKLARANEEAKSARDELEAAKVSIQKEYDTLWVSVHELNKLDNARDKDMKDLIASRDQAVKDRNAANERLKRLAEAYDELQREIKEIDQDLIAVAEAENIQIFKPDTKHRIRGMLR